MHPTISLCSGSRNIFRWKTHFPTEFSSNFPRLRCVGCGEKGELSPCYSAIVYIIALVRVENPPFSDRRGGKFSVSVGKMYDCEENESEQKTFSLSCLHSRHSWPPVINN